MSSNRFSEKLQVILDRKLAEKKASKWATAKCLICGAHLVGVVTLDPVDGQELNRLECKGSITHTIPYNADMAEVLHSRAVASRIMGTANC